MLRLHDVSSEKDKEKVFSLYQPNQDIWLLSNMNDKREMQAKIFQKQNIVLDFHLQRINEFWQELFRYISDEYRYVSQDYFKVWLRESFQFSFSIEEGFIIQFINQMQDYLFDEYQYEVLEEWLKENLQNPKEINELLSVLEEVVSHIKEKKIVSDAFLVKVLSQNLNTILDRMPFQGAIFIDLNFDIMPLETQLFKEIAKKIDVHFLIPAVEPLYLFQPDYRRFFPLIEDSSFLKQSEVLSKVNKPLAKQDLSSYLQDKPIDYFVFSDAIHEILNVIGQVRELIEEGVDKGEIAILAANKERYEYLFQMLATKEGINHSFIYDNPWSTFRSVSKVLSYFKVMAKDYEKSDISLSYLEENRNTKIIDKKFANLYSDKQLESVSDLSKFYKKEKQHFNKMEVLTLLKDKMSDHWDHNLDSIVQSLLSDFDSEEKMSLNTWHYYFDFLSRKMFEKKDNFIEGDLRIQNLLEGSKLSQKYVFILGFNEEDLRYQIPSLLDYINLKKISNDLGLWLENQFSFKKYFSVLYFLKDTDKKLFLSFSEEDLQGNRLHPSTFHYFLNPKKEYKNTYCISLAEESENEDLLKDIRFDGVEIKNYPLKHLSASSIDRYKKCPFIFAAEKVFGFKLDLEEDLQVNNLDRGSIRHEVLQLLIEKGNIHPKEEEVRELLNKIYVKIHLTNKDFKAVFIEEDIYQIQRFLSFERDWRKSHPDISVVGCEIEINGFLDSKGYFSLSEKEIAFKGRIDRVEKDKNENSLLVDYKLGSSHKNSTSWLEEGTLQLATYSLFLQDTGNLGLKGDVVGGIFFSLKSLNRETGYLQIGLDNTLSPIKDRKSFYISKEEKEALFQQTRLVLEEVLSQLKAGEFTPKPIQLEICDTCDWRNLCRAKHLN